MSANAPEPLSGGRRAPTRAEDVAPAGDRLAAALVPVLVHKLNNTTQYLSALNAMIGATGAGCAGLSGLGEASSEIDQMGWLLGVVANACGADLLLERRERAGLAPMVRAVADGLRRDKRDLRDAGRSLPEISVSGPAEHNWRAAWAVGSWLYQCGRSMPERGSLDWELRAEDTRALLVCRTDADPEIVALARDIAAAIEGLEVECRPGSCALRFPPGRLVMGAPRA